MLPAIKTRAASVQIIGTVNLGHLRQCTWLKRLHLTDVKELAKVLEVAAGKTMPELEELLVEMGEEGMSQAAAQAAAQVMKAKKLKRLALSNVGNSEAWAILSAVGPCGLEALTVVAPTWKDSSGVSKERCNRRMKKIMADNAGTLKAVRLAGSPGRWISAAVVAHCPNLESLDLEWVCWVPAAEVAKMPLRELWMDKVQIREDDLQTVLQGQLKNVRLWDLSAGRESGWRPNAAVARALSGAKNLAINRVDDTFISAMGETQYPALETLVLYQESYDSATMTREVLEAMPNLRELITGAWVDEAVLEVLPKLEVMNASTTLSANDVWEISVHEELERRRERFAVERKMLALLVGERRLRERWRRKGRRRPALPAELWEEVAGWAR